MRARASVATAASKQIQILLLWQKKRFRQTVYCLQFQLNVSERLCSSYIFYYFYPVPEDGDDESSELLLSSKNKLRTTIQHLTDQACGDCDEACGDQPRTRNQRKS